MVRCPGELKKRHWINIYLLTEKEAKITINIKKTGKNGIPEEGSKTNRTFSGSLSFYILSSADGTHLYILPRNVISSSGLVGRNRLGWGWQREDHQNSRWREG